MNRYLILCFLIFVTVCALWDGYFPPNKEVSDPDNTAGQLVLCDSPDPTVPFYLRIFELLGLVVFFGTALSLFYKNPKKVHN